MMIELILVFAVSDEQADALRRMYPSYLTVETARENIVSARIAGLTHEIDPSYLLAIAAHESRFTPTEQTWERNVGGFSCGIMTPTPWDPWPKIRKKCAAEFLTMLGGYIHGAEHLRLWLDKCSQNMNLALRGYGPGEDHQAPGFQHWQTFSWNAAKIRRAIAERSI